MAKEGKKPIGKIVLGVIVVLVIVGAVGSMAATQPIRLRAIRQNLPGRHSRLRSKKNRKNRIPLLTRLKTPPISLPIRSRAR